MNSTDFQPKCSPENVRRVAIISAGLIGTAWAARFLAQGLSVKVWDPNTAALEKVSDVIENVWNNLSKRSEASDDWRQRLTLSKSREDALSDVDFVQESGPEDLDLKRKLLSSIDEALDVNVVVASSTSGFRMSEMSRDTKNKQRFLVGHPYNPPYIIPFVEVVPGDGTDLVAARWAVDFYRAMTMQPVLIEREVDGFIGNRMQQAIWNEALHMIDAGEAKVEQIELAFTHALGPRWSLLGPFMTYHLAGGEGGMRAFLDKFAGPNEDSWTRLAAPPFTDQLKQKVIDGSEAEAGSRSVSEIEAWRDDYLTRIFEVVRAARETGSKQ